MTTNIRPLLDAEVYVVLSDIPYKGEYTDGHIFRVCDTLPDIVEALETMQDKIFIIPTAYTRSQSADDLCDEVWRLHEEGMYPTIHKEV